MITKEDILKKYHSYSAEGLPEISADDLLKAMEEYKQQAEEKAFEAARMLNADAAYLYPNYSAYQESQVVPPTDETAIIRMVADSILPQFLPEDATVEQFSFPFRTNAVNYKACYIKDANGYWVMDNYTIE